MTEGMFAGAIVFVLLMFFAFSVVTAVISFMAALVALAIRVGTIVLVIGFVGTIAAGVAALVGGTSFFT